MYTIGVNICTVLLKMHLIWSLLILSFKNFKLNIELHQFEKIIFRMPPLYKTVRREIEYKSNF